MKSLHEIGEEMQQEINGIVSDDFMPNTLMFGLWKLKLRKKIQEKYNTYFYIDWEGQIKHDGFGHVLIYISFLYFLTKKWFPADKIINFLHSFYILKKRYNLIALLRPYFWHKVGDHLFLINRREKKGLMQAILRDYLLKKDWEPETTKLVKSILKPGNTAVVVGASIGYFTMTCAKLVGPTGRTIAVEPTDFQFSYLLKNIKKNGYSDWVTAYCVAAWDKDEIVSVPLNASESNKVTVQGRSVFSLLKERNIEKVDFIKIDTDGSEPWVLRGLIPVFEKSPNLKMVIEWYPKYVDNAGGNIEEVKEILDKYFDYQIIRQDYEDGGQTTHCNLYCVRK